LVVFGFVAWLVLVIIILPIILAAFHFRDNPPAIPPYQCSLVPIPRAYWSARILVSKTPHPCPSVVPQVKVGVDRAGSANSDSGLSGGSVLPQPKMAGKRRADEQTTPSEPQGGIQGEGGLGCAEG
jgi:hypothetical protein